MNKPLTKQELHNLAMNHVGKDLEQRGFEFVAINSKLKKHPQFVCIDKNSQYYFSFKKHARDKDAKVLYAGVGLGNMNEEKGPIYLNKEYLLEYNGIQIVETNLN